MISTRMLPSAMYRGARKMKLLSIQEVADAMGVSGQTVRRLIKRGRLAAYKVGERGQLRVKEGELERYLEARRVKVDETSETERGG